MRATLYAITIVPESGMCPEGELPQFQLPSFCTDARRTFHSSAPKADLLACVDISRNDTTAIDGTIYHQFHLHGIMIGLKKGYRDQLRAAFKWKSGDCARPVVIKPVVNVAGQLAYMAKPNFVRRISYCKTGRNTRIEKLSIAEEAEITQSLLQYRADQRIIRVGDIIASCTRLAKYKLIKTTI